MDDKVQTEPEQSNNTNELLKNVHEPEEAEVNHVDETNEPPQLKFQGMTPVTKTPAPKRPCTVLSPIGEVDVESTMSKLIEDSFEKSIQKMMPQILQTVKDEVRTTINDIVDAKIEELQNKLSLKIDLEQEKAKLKTLSEAELLESYNRRDNVKILGVEQILRDGERESYHETANIVMSIAKDLNTEITPQDVSIAHRLPAYNGVKPIICKFTRRTKKIELLTNKKNFRTNSKFSSIKIFEDTTKARHMFLGLMKRDERIDAAWIRDGSIFYKYVENDAVHKIQGLFEGSKILGYSPETTLKCFENSKDISEPMQVSVENTNKLNNSLTQTSTTNFDRPNNFTNEPQNYRQAFRHQNPFMHGQRSRFQQPRFQNQFSNYNYEMMPSYNNQPFWYQGPRF